MIQELLASGKARCAATISSDGWYRSRQCDHPAKATIDGSPLCGVHMRVAIDRKQRVQKEDLTYLASLFRDAVRVRIRARNEIAEYLLSSVELGSDHVYTFTAARGLLAGIEEEYQEAVAKVIVQIDEALASNLTREYPLASDSEAVANALAMRARAQEIIGGLTD